MQTDLSWLSVDLVLLHKKALWNMVKEEIGGVWLPVRFAGSEKRTEGNKRTDISVQTNTWQEQRQLILKKIIASVLSVTSHMQNSGPKQAETGSAHVNLNIRNSSQLLCGFMHYCAQIASQWKCDIYWITTSFKVFFILANPDTLMPVVDSRFHRGVLPHYEH